MASITTDRTIFLVALMVTLSLVAFSAITPVKAQEEEEDEEESEQDIENNQEIEQDMECKNGADCEAAASNTYIICEEGSTCVFKEDPTVFPVYT